MPRGKITFTFKEPIFLEFMVFQNPASTTVFEESIIVATLGINSDNESKYFVSKELEYDNTSQWIDINSEILYDLTLKIVKTIHKILIIKSPDALYKK